MELVGVPIQNRMSFGPTLPRGWLLRALVDNKELGNAFAELVLLGSYANMERSPLSYLVEGLGNEQG